MKKVVSFIICCLFLAFPVCSFVVEARPPNDGEFVWIEPKCAPGFCLDADRRTIERGANGATCNIWGHVEEGAACQTWHAEKISDVGLQYKFICGANGGFLRRPKALIEFSDSRVATWSSDWGTNQRWTLTDAGDGYFFIINQASGNYLTVNGDSGGSEVWGYQFTGSDAQKWRIH